MTFATAGVATPVGCAVMAHGLDHFFTGMNSVITGRPVESVTSQLFQTAGMSPQNAHLLDTGLSLAGPVAGMKLAQQGAGAFRASTVNTGGKFIPAEVKCATNGGMPSLDSLSRAGQVMDRGGFTVGGRSLTKHAAGARQGNSLFPTVKGNPRAVNFKAQNIVDDILTTPSSVIQNSYRGRFGNTIEVSAPDGRGLVYDANGKFLFFKE